jgi:hypothetical protein
MPMFGVSPTIDIFSILDSIPRVSLFAGFSLALALLGLGGDRPLKIGNGAEGSEEGSLGRVS